MRKINNKMEFNLENKVNLDLFLQPLSPVDLAKEFEAYTQLKETPPPPPYPGRSLVELAAMDQALSPPPMPSPSPGMYSACSTPMPYQQCISPCPSVWSNEPDQISEQLSEFKLETTMDLDVAEAIMAAEATGSQMPVIKNELKYKIQKKRRESGLEELTVEYPEQKPEMLTDKDKDRRERRKASNRRAAAKCRIKKKNTAQQKEEERLELEKANKLLRDTIERLERERDQYKELLLLHAPCFMDNGR